MRANELAKEWTRVLPLDKELRAYLRWRWLRLGFDWDPVSGERRGVDEGLRERVWDGGVVVEGMGEGGFEGMGEGIEVGEVGGIEEGEEAEGG